MKSSLSSARFHNAAKAVAQAPQGIKRFAGKKLMLALDKLANDEHLAAVLGGREAPDWHGPIGGLAARGVHGTLKGMRKPLAAVRDHVVVPLGDGLLAEGSVPPAAYQFLRWASGTNKPLKVLHPDVMAGIEILRRTGVHVDKNPYLLGRPGLATWKLKDMNDTHFLYQHYSHTNNLLPMMIVPENSVDGKPVVVPGTGMLNPAILDRLTERTKITLGQFEVRPVDGQTKVIDEYDFEFMGPKDGDGSEEAPLAAAYGDAAEGGKPASMLINAARRAGLVGINWDKPVMYQDRVTNQQTSSGYKVEVPVPTATPEMQRQAQEFLDNRERIEKELRRQNVRWYYGDDEVADEFV